MKRAIIILCSSAFVVVTIILLLIYAAVQQSYRTAANDPQLQMAYDIAAQAEGGKTYALTDTIDVAKSLSPFVVLYNEAGLPVQSSGYLDHQFPQVPKGALEYTEAHGENRVTWQPRPDVRMAMVIKKITSPTASFIAVGRSLQEVERRETDLRRMVFIAWVLCSFLLGMSAILSFRSVRTI